jgi:uncharacterized protein (TIGR02271 family)
LSDKIGPDGKPLHTDSPSQPGSTEQAQDEAKVQLAAEELSVTKEKQVTGRVRVSTVTREHEELVDEDLLRERVEIETVPVGRQINTMPVVREEGDTTVIPVVEEVVVVERRLMLKEEIRIRRVRTTERHQERVTLRRQEAMITRSPAEPDDAATAPPAGAERKPSKEK